MRNETEGTKQCGGSPATEETMHSTSLSDLTKTSFKRKCHSSIVLTLAISFTCQRICNVAFPTVK